MWIIYTIIGGLLAFGLIMGVAALIGIIQGLYIRFTRKINK